VVGTPRRRRGPLIAIAAALVFLLGAGGVFLWQQQQESDDAADDAPALTPTDVAGAAAGSVGEVLLGTPDAAPATPVAAPPVIDDAVAAPAIGVKPRDGEVAKADPEPTSDRKKRDRRKRDRKKSDKGKKPGKTPDKPDKPDTPVPVDKPAGPEKAPF
jgi:hypothetical protein